MSSKTPKNTAASVRDRLLTIAKQRNVEFTHVLQQYVNERILYRLSKTRYASDFTLKGGTLFGLLFEQPHRPTKDLDFLGQGNNEAETQRTSFFAVLSEKEDDGVDFHLDTLEAEKIKEDEQYEGVRLRCTASIEQALISIQIDIGFGDAVLSQNKVVLKTLLNLPRPELFVYPIESVISEKFEAMVKLGLTNSRMKDFYDIYTFSKELDFEAAALREAITQTFVRRQTTIPSETPLALTKNFFENKDKIAQWKAFAKRVRTLKELELETVCSHIEQFIMPVAKMANDQTSIDGCWSRLSGWNLGATLPD